MTDAPRVEPAPIWPGLTQMAELQKMLWASDRPIAILGGGGWTKRASAAFARFAERFDLPVAGSFRRASAFDGEHDNFAGEIGFSVNPKLKARVEAADLVLLVGSRMSEAAAQGYTLFSIPAPRQRLVHVHADANEIGRNYHPALGIVATSPEFCAALEGVEPPATIRWSAETRAARADYLAWSEQAPPNPGRVQLSEIMFAIRRRSPDGIFTNGAGNFSIWVGRFLRFRRVEQQLGPTSGSMGFGLPAAIGAQRVFPKRTVVCFAGDGDFLMNGQEFATAVQYGLPIVVVVIDNGMYGTIRMHQERMYPGRVIGTALRNPDFAAYARAFGGHGETVEETAEFLPAYERALASGLPSILHVKVDPEAITPATTLSAIRAQALEKARSVLEMRGPWHVRLNVESSRPLRANSGRSPTALRTGQKCDQGGRSPCPGKPLSGGGGNGHCLNWTAGDSTNIRHHVKGFGAQIVQGRMALDLSNQRAGKKIIQSLVALEEIDSPRLLFRVVQKPNFPAQPGNRGKKLQQSTGRDSGNQPCWRGI